MSNAKPDALVFFGATGDLAAAGVARGAYVFVFLRSFYQDPKNLTPAVQVMEATKIYPLKGKAKLPPNIPAANSGR